MKRRILTLLTAFVLLSSSFTFSSCKSCNKNKGKDGGENSPVTNRDKDKGGDESAPIDEAMLLQQIQKLVDDGLGYAFAATRELKNGNPTAAAIEIGNSKDLMKKPVVAEARKLENKNKNIRDHIKALELLLVRVERDEAIMELDEAIYDAKVKAWRALAETELPYMQADAQVDEKANTDPVVINKRKQAVAANKKWEAQWEAPENKGASTIVKAVYIRLFIVIRGLPPDVDIDEDGMLKNKDAMKEVNDLFREEVNNMLAGNGAGDVAGDMNDVSGD